ncbi:ABC transporter ATP-binding protein [soil metagenome]
MAAIDVDDLVVRYGGLTAVDHLSFSVDRGEVVALLGPNGAGKTTTVETLEGYRRPTAGAVRVLGLDPVADHSQLSRRACVMLQQGGIYPGIRPYEALRLFAAFYADPEDPERLLDRVGLAHRRGATWRQLSGGEQQRLSLALALVGRPEVVFLDEPTAGVDVAGRQAIREMVGDLRARGVAVLVATHDLEDAERGADRVLIVDHGQMVAAGTPDELRQPFDGAEIRFAARPALDTASLGDAVGTLVVEVAPGEYRVAAPPSPTTVAAVTAWPAERDVALGDLRAVRQLL